MKNNAKGDGKSCETPFGLSRRKFLSYCSTLAGSAILLGCGDNGGSDSTSDTLTDAASKPPVLWLSGQECTGCSCNFLNIEEPGIAEVILDTISLRYHEAIMAASGTISESALDQTIEAGNYVLIVEGSIPAADDRFCQVGGTPFREIVERAAAGADVVIAAGACAAFGGIPRATVSKGAPVTDYVSGTPVINLPHCPAHQEQLLETIIYWLTEKSVPALDAHKRPVVFFSQRIHDQCPRRPSYDAGHFLTDWNNPTQTDYCLALKGCLGPNTKSDCITRKYNGGVNHCIDSGAPCVGCARPDFMKEPQALFVETSTDKHDRKEVLV